LDGTTPPPADFDPAVIEASVLRRLHAYWNARRAGRAMPARADLDPTKFAWALGAVSLMERLDDGDWAFRVDATTTADHFAVDMTGKRLSKYPDAPVRALMQTTLDAVVAARVPMLVHRDFLFNGLPRRYELLLLPLSADGVRVDMILSMPGLDGARPSAPLRLRPVS
jgi:hypothetical protein